MAPEELEGDGCVCRIVLGAAGRERSAVLRERARVHREDHEDVVLEQGGDDGTLREFETHGDALASETITEPTSPVLDGLGAVLDDRELDGVGIRGLQADVVLAIGPVDTDERGEFRLFLHGDLLDLGSGRDMQSRAQRRQYGEPVRRLSLSVRFGQRHTRGLEAELESVTRSALQIRSPRVHVPLRSSRAASGCPKWNSPPI